MSYVIALDHPNFVAVICGLYSSLFIIWYAATCNKNLTEQSKKRQIQHHNAAVKFLNRRFKSRMYWATGSQICLTIYNLYIRCLK